MPARKGLKIIFLHIPGRPATIRRLEARWGVLWSAVGTIRLLRTHPYVSNITCYVMLQLFGYSQRKYRRRSLLQPPTG